MPVLGWTQESPAGSGPLDRAERVPEKSPGWNPWCGLRLLAEYQTLLRADLWGPSRG